MSLDKDQVQHIAVLARLKLADDEFAETVDKLSRIVDFVDQLSQAETTWLALTTALDPYLELTTGTPTKQSSTKTTTYTPLYNEPLLSAKASDLMAAIKYLIWDDDTTSFDDKVVECDTARQ